MLQCNNDSLWEFEDEFFCQVVKLCIKCKLYNLG